MAAPLTLWNPPKEALARTRMGQFLTRVNQEHAPEEPLRDYADLHRWSVEHRTHFWKTWLSDSGILFSGSPDPVEVDTGSLGGRFFPEVRLNFAENLLRFRDERVALISLGEDRDPIHLTAAELYNQVASLRRTLIKRGVQTGDRVAAMLPNVPEAVVAMLATTSLGAIWSSCSPDFGTAGVLDRFSQIEPRVLFTCNGYTYGGKRFSCLEKVERILGGLPTLETTVVLDCCPTLPSTLKTTTAQLTFADALAEPAEEITFPSFPFNHPLYILYSSGTTGIPKCIVHGAGGTLLQHTKELMLHSDLRPADRILYYTTCGWMMWNWLVSSLFVGASVALFDGSPGYPRTGRLWEVTAEEGITHLGTSPRYLGACRDEVSPKNEGDLSALRVVMSTGAPLLPEDFDWVYNEVSPGVLLASISGGTDIISCFMLGNPLLPVIRGELQAFGLGMDVAAYNRDHQPVQGEKGELVCRAPFPSMPIGFWNDPNHQKYRQAYFPHGDAVWYHGDYVSVTGTVGACGGVVVHGRSDATLNPGGIRIGTAEIYRLVETLPWVADSIVVGQAWSGDVRVVLFVQPKAGTPLNPERRDELRRVLREQASPRHVPAKVVSVTGVPYTISGKKVEIAVRQIIDGIEPANKDALINPEILDEFRDLKELQS